jgi:predicted PurR-regulated permease PerM
MAQPLIQERATRFLLVIACIVVVIAGLKAAATLLVPFMISLFLAMISLPLVHWLHARRVPTAIAVVITLMLLLMVLASIGLLLGGSVQAFTTRAPEYRNLLEERLGGVIDWLQARGLTITRDMADDFIKPGRVMDVVTGTLRGVAAVFSNLFLVMLTIVFILMEATGFRAKLHAAFGGAEAAQRFDNIRTQVQRYLGIKTLISLTTGSIVAAAMAIIGVDFPLLWGLVAFLLNYVPSLGSIIAAIPPILLALVQLGAGHAIAVAAVFITINIALGNFAEPYFMGRRLGLSTLVVFLSLIFWGWVWGPLGMILSVPLTMIARITFENTEDLRWIAVLLGDTPDVPPPAPRVPGTES